MKKGYVVQMLSVLFLLISLNLYANTLLFVDSEEMLKNYYNREDVVLVASPGRSGSTLLAALIYSYASNYDILKTHILLPSKEFKGKILFIFSNPDLAAESALHMMINDAWWGHIHFNHVKSADQKWLEKIGDTSKQTLQDNLLAYDALGCYQQLVEWLCHTEPCEREEAQILAIKYENLWDSDTIEAIKQFLRIDHLQLPDKKERGYTQEELDPKEISFKSFYNLGTDQAPRYAAYDQARDIWLKMPAIQYLKLPSARLH